MDIQQQIEAVFAKAFSLISTGNLEEGILLVKKQKVDNQYKAVSNLILDLLHKEEFLCNPNTKEIATYLEWYTDIEVRLITIMALTNLSEAISKGEIDEEIKRPILKYTQCLLWIFGKEIVKESGNYPEESISGQIWFNGKIARELALRMALIFEKEKENFYELDMYNIRANITTSIMSHYHHLVGPAMIDVANCFIKNNKIQQAKGHFNAIFLDFEWLVDAYQVNEEITMEDQISMQSLKSACEGLSQLNEGNTKIKKVLKKLKNLL